MFNVKIVRDFCSSTRYEDTNGSWGSCSADCGGGTKSYTVTRTYYSNYTGQYCSQEQVVTGTQSCNTHSCKTCRTETVNIFGVSGRENWGCQCKGYANTKEGCENDLKGEWKYFENIGGYGCTVSALDKWMLEKDCRAISAATQCFIEQEICD